MATYKKRGNKVRKKEDIIEEVDNLDALAEGSTTEEIFNTLDETANKSEEWVIKNQKYIYSVLGILVVGIVGYLAYMSLFAAPQERIAADELAFPRKYYDLSLDATTERDSLLTLGIEGADNKLGFVNIAEDYKGTEAGNLACYYAGISYLKMRQFDKAIEYLDQFSSDDAVLNPIAKGAIGDAFSELQQKENAYKYYKEAVQLSSNSFTTPIYLQKVAGICMDLKKYNEASSYFERIKKEYPKSNQAADIDLYINRAKYANKG